MSFPWAKEYTPANGFTKWVDEKLPLPRFVYNAVGAGYPVPRNLNYMWNFGVLAGFCLVLQIVTGVVLAMHYAANAQVAFGTVEHIMRDVNWGWMLRYMHANGASFFFLVLYLHIFRGFFYSSYKAPREMIWLLGVVIFLLAMATAFMGYVLPWGQQSFWAATVITNLFSAVPLIGDSIVTWLWGGFSVDNPTLNRFFAFHYLLPFVLIGLVFVHLWALHVHKSNNPLGIDIKGPQDTIPFHPYYTIKDLYGLGVFMVFFMFFVFYQPNFFGEPDNYIKANPMVTPTHIVPEWYFLPSYAILRAVPEIWFISAKLGGVIAMFGSTLILMLLPWLDRSPVRSARFRPIYRQFFWVFFIDCIILGWVGANTPDAVFHGIPFLWIGRTATVYYFAHFLILIPLISILEKPKMPPQSISAAVTGTASKGAE